MRRFRANSKLPVSGPQIEISLRLQFRDPDHAAPVRTDEAGQQILQGDILRFHGVAAGGEFNARLGKPADTPDDIGIGGRRMKRPERRAMDDKRAARRKVMELVKRVFADLTSQLAAGTADLWHKVEQRLSQKPNPSEADFRMLPGAPHAPTPQPVQQQQSKSEPDEKT